MSTAQQLQTSSATEQDEALQRRRASFLSVVMTTVKKQLTLRFRYKANIVGESFEFVLRLVIFGAMAGAVTLIGVNSLEGSNVFVFFLASIMLIVFSSVALSAPLTAVIQDLNNGTLEYLFSTPMSKYAYFVGTTVAEALSRLVYFLPIYLILIFCTGVSLLTALVIGVVCAVVVIGLIAFGVCVALMGLMWKQVGAISSLLFTLFEFICGAYFPVTSMPAPLQAFAFLLPHTWGYDLVRYYSFQGSWVPILPVEIEWLLLAVYGVLYVFLSSRLLRVVENRAKREGLHLI